MHIKINWKAALPLWNGARKNLIYDTDFEAIPTTPGLYVFLRKHGKSERLLYIGQGNNLQRRIYQQINNLSLMKAIENSPAGRKFLLIGELLLRQGQRPNRVLNVAEAALIKHYLGEGHELLNIRGTSINTHIIESERSSSRRLIPKRIYAEKR